MKASLLVLALIIAAFQTTPPSPQAGPREQASTPVIGQSVPLDAAHCKCSIEVTVKHAGTGEPISDAVVSLSGTMNLEAPSSVTADFGAFAAIRAGRLGAAVNSTTTIMTDSSGRAIFRDLAEGSYNIQARRAEYSGANDTYSDQASEGGVNVGPASQTNIRGMKPQPVQQVALRMVQGGTISGSIFDANRRPASAVQVGAYRVVYQDGHRVLTQTGTTVQSDDRGEYRLFWFPPGEYYVRTGATTEGLRAAIAGNGVINASGTSYYPGTTDPRAAIPIAVREGTDLKGIDIALQASAGVTVSGTIINTIPSGNIEPQRQGNQPFLPSFLVPRDSHFFEAPVALPSIGGGRGFRGGNQPSNSGVPFEIHGVPPGSYDFYAVYTDTTAGFGGNRFSARTPIEVGTENVTGVQSVIRPGTNLNGHVTFIGAPPLALTSIRVLLRPKGNMPTLVTAGVAAPVGADGGFTIANLIDAPYFVAGISSLPDDAYVSDIRQDARNVFDENIITIGKDAQTTLEVVVSRGGATLQGIVQDAKHNPASAARITLIPDMPRRQNVLLYKTATSNAIGSFKLSGLAPGTYTLFAWEHIPNGAEQNEDFIHDYEALGVSVIVSSRLPLTNIQLPLIPKKR